MTGLKVKYLVLGSIHQITPSPQKKGNFFLEQKYCKFKKSTLTFSRKIVQNVEINPPPLYQKITPNRGKGFCLSNFYLCNNTNKINREYKTNLG